MVKTVKTVKNSEIRSYTVKNGQKQSKMIKNGLKCSQIIKGSNCFCFFLNGQKQSKTVNNNQNVQKFQKQLKTAKKGFLKSGQERLNTVVKKLKKKI